eukprot:COSAG02_NODE_20494_length_829_cov_0.558904_1_plen_136_part_01
MPGVFLDDENGTVDLSPWIILGATMILVAYCFQHSEPSGSTSASAARTVERIKLSAAAKSVVCIGIIGWFLVLFYGLGAADDRCPGVIFDEMDWNGKWTVLVPGAMPALRAVGFFKQKTAYEIMSGDWSSDVCSSD